MDTHQTERKWQRELREHRERSADPDPGDRLRTMNYEVAEAVAPTWERRRPWIEQVAAPVREWLVRELDPRSGDTVLELAAGVGDTGFEVAAILGETGRLISTDFSPAMVEAARRRGAELGVANVDYRVIDAERIELDADSVDGVICRFGYMLMADPAAALAETRRVLRPGRRVVLAVWGPPERNPFFAVIAGSLVERGHLPPPDPEAPGLFNMGSEDRTQALLAGAGFTTVRTEYVPVGFTFAGVDEYLSICRDTAGPIALVLQGLSDAEHERISVELNETLKPFASDDGYALPGLALAGVAS